MTHSQGHRSKVKDQYGHLRNRTKLLQIKRYVLECLESGEHPDLQEEEEQFQQTRSTGRQLKEELADAQESLREMFTDIEKYHMDFETEFEKMKTQVKRIREKKLRVEEMQKLQNEKKSAEAKDKFLKKEAELSCLLETLTSVESEISASQIQFGQLQETASNLKESLQDLKEQLSSIQVQRHQTEENTAQHKKTLQKVEWLQKLSSLQRVDILPSPALSVKFLNEDLPSSDIEEGRQQELTLKINFTSHWNGNHKLQGAEVDVDTLCIDDLLKTAIQRDDIVYLVHEVSARWHEHHYFSRELKKLHKKKLPLDWLTSENILRVLLGKDAQVVCSLFVPPDYPSTGIVQLRSIQGLSLQEDLSSIKPPQDNPTVTDWLDYLQDLTDSVTHKPDAPHSDLEIPMIVAT